MYSFFLCCVLKCGIFDFRIRFWYVIIVMLFFKNIVIMVDFSILIGYNKILDDVMKIVKLVVSIFNF